MTGISIVIRAYNSAKTLDSVLAGMSLLQEDEYIVVDSGSTDDTLKIAQRYGAKIIMATGSFNYSKSLNLGFQAAVNPWVLVISSHSIPAVPDFMDIYRRNIVQFPADVVVGYAPATITGRSTFEPENDQIRYYGRDDYIRVSEICGNGNTIYRRSLWEELPFDETIRTSEDKIWIMETIKRGHRFAYIPQARTLNRNQASLRYMFRKGYSDALTLRKPDHRPMNLYELGGALKNLAQKKWRGETDTGNWLRYSAHTFGQFFASYRDEDNTPWK
jgi:glycosyltransferase involved in cell wall biosynthesis